MSTQYTNQAKTAVKYAEKTARRYKHSYIGTEHLLAGLLHEEEGTAGMVDGNDPEADCTGRE